METQTNRFIFQLDEDEIKRYEAWHKKLKKKKPLPSTAIGGGETFMFTPTGLGTVVEVERADGEKINLTDFSTW